LTTHVSRANSCSQPEAIDIARLFYQNLYETEDIDEMATNQILNSLPQISSMNNDRLIEPISSEEINNVIKKLPNNKSPRADGLSYEFYKSLSPLLLSHLTLLFNQILLTNKSPLSWKVSNIVLIPKKSEDKSLIQNWRPIALLNSDCKIFMKIIANRLNKKILNTIIGSHQSGFCANRNILDAFLEYNMILENPNKIPTPSWLVFLDQKKAYDRVNHNYLLQTLSSFGFSIHFCELIKNLYRDQTATISDKGIVSESFSLERGV
jgi:hypothetical protein